MINKTIAWIGAALLITTAAACGSETEEPTPPGTPEPAAAAGPSDPAAPVTDPATPPAATPPVPAGPPCTGKEALTGDLDWTVTAGAKTRTLHVHVPTKYDRAKPTPVVLNFHGYSSNAMQQDLLAHMSEKADAASFIAVHPEGIGITQSWNAGACCGEAMSSAVDDMAFVGKMIDELKSKLCVDSHRVFATGMSNGGFLSHRLACEMSDRIAAVAPVAGVLGIPTCLPKRPMPIFHFHGTYDTVVPYDGSPTEGFASVQQTISGWATRNGCSTTARETSKKSEVTCVTYDGCKAGAEVSLCSVTGGGHTWPGGFPVPSLGYTTTNLNATDAMWDFFVKHPLP